MQNSEITFRFGSYNVGVGWGDYKGMLAADQESADIVNTKLENLDPASEAYGFAVGVLQDDVEKYVANQLSLNLDVIALQEVKVFDRKFVRVLRENGFNIYCIANHPGIPYKEELFDTAVALRSDLFEDVENKSVLSISHPLKIGYGQEIAAVVAKIRGCNLKFAFSSAHNWGFQLYPENMNQKLKRYDQRDNKQMGYAVTYMEEVKANINLQQDVACSLIGGDLNNNPENQPAQFNLMQEDGHELLRAGKPTNVNRFDEVHNYKYREIDFIFFRSQNQYKPTNFFSKLYRYTTGRQATFNQTVITRSMPSVMKGFDFKYGSNCSDHQPVMTTVTVAQNK